MGHDHHATHLFAAALLLLVIYARLAINEEAERSQRVGAAFDAYAARTPRFVQSWRTEQSIA